MATSPAPKLNPILPGDIACVPVPGPVGAFIGVGEIVAGAPFTRHRLPGYDHTLVYAGELPGAPVTKGAVPDSQGQLGRGHYVFEAHPGGARYRKLDYGPGLYPGALWSSGLIPFRDTHQRLTVQMNCQYLAGTPYSALDYGAIGLHRYGLNTSALQRYIAATGHMICSQLADYVLATAGIHLFSDGRWPGYVDPWDIARLLLARQLSQSLNPPPAEGGFLP